MIWHWLVNGLGGLVAMMAKHAGESREPMPEADAENLFRHIRDLNAILAASRSTPRGEQKHGS